MSTEKELPIVSSDGNTFDVDNEAVALNSQLNSMKISTEKKLTIVSSDGETIVVDEAVALKSQLIKRMIEHENCSDNFIMSGVTSKTLVKVIEYCKKHVEKPKRDDPSADYELESWNALFVMVDHATLLDLICAADYMEIEGLSDLTCQKLADMIEGKTSNEICSIFKIKREDLPEGLETI